MTTILAVMAILSATVAWSNDQPVSGRIIGGVGYSAKMDSAEIEGAAGAPIRLKVVMDPPEPPTGHYVSVLIDVLDAPTRPEITTGYPEATIISTEPGKYKLLVRVNIVGKSSCAGVQPYTVGELPVTLIIR